MTDTAAGPFVGLAVLCQHVERKPDGSMDILGSVEGVLLEPPERSEADPLGLRPLAVLPLRLLIALRAGDIRGWHDVEVVGRYPAGNTGPSTGVRVEFTAERPTATINVPVELEVHEAGTYRFDVVFDGRLLTTVPLQVVVGGAAPA
jgi:hypothetical protein